MSDITIAASAQAFTELFTRLRDNFTFAHKDSGSFAVFSASYAVALHLEKGNVALNNDNTVEVSDLDVVWDTLNLTICFDLPEWRFGGFCMIPTPLGCLVSFPEFRVGGPVCAPLDLSGLVSKIADVKARLVPRYFVDPARLPAWTDLDAEIAGHPNKWRIFVDPEWVQVDPIDLPASLPNLFERAVRKAINNAIPSWVPGWARDILWAVLGPLVAFVSGLLRIVGDIADFLTGLLTDALPFGFDLLGVIERAVTDYLASGNPIWWFEDPYPLTKGGPALRPIPVKIPLRDVAALIDSNEMVIHADVGAST
jgi:hypothetical protein